jgi:dTMP kinase
MKNHTAHSQFPGFLFSVEGIDGSGKSTFVKNLAEKLQQQYEILCTREPGGSELGKHIRPLLQNKPCNMSSKSEFLLFAADRAQHFQEKIIPALQHGTIVISDRMADSSLVYQGVLRGLNMEMLKIINSWCMEQIEPDATLYLKIDAATAVARMNERNKEITVLERQVMEHKETLVSGFDLVFKNRDRVYILDAAQSPQELAEAAYNIIATFVSKK